MKMVGTFEAKTQLSRLIDEVLAGEEVVITRHGKPEAVLKAYQGEEKNDPKAAVAAMQAFNKKPLGGQSIKALLEEGRP